MEIRININMDGDAFTGDGMSELHRILHKLAGHIGELGLDGAPRRLMDVNGNTVGVWDWND